MFYRLDDHGDAAIFHHDGTRAISLDANVYPVHSALSARYTHLDGITLTVEDARALGIPAEDD